MSEENYEVTNSTNTTVNIPSEYKPIGPWGYLGYQILFSIPLVGFICALVFAVGATQNVNVRNFARSYFCGLLIGILIGIICGLVVFVFGAAIFSSSSSMLYY